MNEHEFDTAARAWLDDGPTRMSDHALLSALDEIHTTRQRRALWQAWRTSPVSMLARVAAAAVLVAAVGFLTVNLLRPRSAPSVAASPTSSPTVAASPTPAPSGSPAESFEVPALTRTFVSPIHGYSATYPERGPMSPATEPWAQPEPLAVRGRPLGSIFDWKETGYAAGFFATSTAIPEGVSLDEWIDQSVAPAATTSTCMLPRARQAEIGIDGQLAKISEGCAHQFLATVVAGGRLYVFVLGHMWEDEAKARTFFDRWLATIHLTPETAAQPSGAPASP
jgi:hypothetical protein